MRRPPRDPARGLFTRTFVSLAVLQGAVVLVASLVVHLIAVRDGQDIGSARTLTFATLTVGLLGLILTNRSMTEPILHSLTRRNWTLWWMLAAVPAVLLALLTQSGTREVFHFSEVPALSLALSAAAGLLVWLVLDVAEQAWLRFRRRPPRGRPTE
jgi:Ca2+-transporting ATPase